MNLAERGKAEELFSELKRFFFFQGLTRCAIASFNWCRNKYLVLTTKSSAAICRDQSFILFSLKGNPKCIGLNKMSIKYDRINRNRIEQVRCGQLCC